MTSPYKGKTGLVRIWNALFYSLDGLKAAFKHEDAFRQEFLLASVLVPLGLWLGETGSEKAMLAGVVLMVLVVELLNSGIEAVVDKASPETNELAKRAKDMGSAAVLISLSMAFLVWLLVLSF
ncbi:MAG: diacylglycerol kinase [Hydrogenophilaceae bacterium]|nr:diacylglycerol kinase [Hydrogenophilaceae bacterium]